MIRWNLFFEVEKVEQLALIDPLATHHDRPPSLKASGKRNHDSSIFTRPFSTGSTQSGHRPNRNPHRSGLPARQRAMVRGTWVGSARSRFRTIQVWPKDLFAGLRQGEHAVNRASASE